MTKDEQIEYILNNFDFEKVHKVMVFLNWQWYGIGIPSIEQLRNKALYYLNNVWDNKLISSGSGGLIAVRKLTTEGNKLELRFELEVEYVS